MDYWKSYFVDREMVDKNLVINCSAEIEIS